MTKHTAFQTLEAMCIVAYGKTWISSCSEDTGVARTTITRWRDGVTPFGFDHPIFGDMQKVLRRKGRTFAKLADVAESIVARHGTVSPMARH